jgi:hypothetical protein
MYSFVDVFSLEILSFIGQKKQIGKGRRFYTGPTASRTHLRRLGGAGGFGASGCGLVHNLKAVERVELLLEVSGQGFEKIGSICPLEAVFGVDEVLTGIGVAFTASGLVGVLGKVEEVGEAQPVERILRAVYSGHD